MKTFFLTVICGLLFLGIASLLFSAIRKGKQRKREKGIDLLRNMGKE